MRLKITVCMCSWGKLWTQKIQRDRPPRKNTQLKLLKSLEKKTLSGAKAKKQRQQETENASREEETSQLFLIRIQNTVFLFSSNFSRFGKYGVSWAERTMPDSGRSGQEPSRQGRLCTSCIFSRRESLLLQGISSSRGSSQPRNRTHVSCISWYDRWILYHWATWETQPMKLPSP